MKYFVFMCAVALFSITGLAGEFTKKMEPFTKASFVGEFNVYLMQGNEDKVQVVNRHEGLKDEDIMVTHKNGYLKVYIKSDLYMDEYDLDIHVTYKELKEVKAKMSCNVSFKNVLKGDEFILLGETGASIKADFKAEKVDITSGSGCEIHVTGTAEKAELNSNLGGTVGAVGLKCDEVEASIKAGGDIVCYATKKLVVDIASGGTVTYKGDPEEFEQEIFLGGKVKKMGEGSSE